MMEIPFKVRREMYLASQNEITWGKELKSYYAIQWKAENKDLYVKTLKDLLWFNGL